MLLNVNKLLHTPDAAQDVQFTMDLSDMEFGGGYPVSQPVTVEGRLRNKAGVLLCTLEASTTLHCVRPLRKTLHQGQDRHLPVRAGRGTAVR